jgi:hypothetical protein
MVKSLNTIRRGIAPQNDEPVLVLSYPCLIMPAKISWFFQPIPFFVGNLAQNSTRFSLSNEPFLLIKSCVFFFCVHANNIMSTPLYLQNQRTKFFGVFPFFPKQQAWPHVFTRIFGKSKCSTKTEIMLVFVQTNKFWKFRWFLREVTIHLKNPKKKQWSDSKSWVLFAWIMRNHSAYSHESKAYRS